MRLVGRVGMLGIATLHPAYVSLRSSQPTPWDEEPLNVGRDEHGSWVCILGSIGGASMHHSSYLNPAYTIG